MIKKLASKQKRPKVKLLPYHGIIFKSRLELYAYKKLKEAKIKFDYEKYSFIIMNKFDFNGKSMEMYRRKGEKIFDWQSPMIRSISYKPDFVNLRNGWIIECKGHPNDAFPNKWKLFKQYLNDNEFTVDLFMPRNNKQIDIVIEYIKKNY